MKKKIMFDSNVFDQLETFIDKIENSDMYDVYITQIQIDQLNAIPDIEKRNKLLELLKRLSPEILAITVFAFPMNFTGSFMFGKGEVFKNIQSIPKKPHNQLSEKKIARLVTDPKIADTAVSNGCILITDDARLREKMNNNDYEAYSVEDFIASLSI